LTGGTGRDVPQEIIPFWAAQCSPVEFNDELDRLGLSENGYQSTDQL
jgi:hypothetical protein